MIAKIDRKIRLPRFLLCFLLALGAPVTSTVAGSLIQIHLATVSKIQMIFPIGGLHHNPPPGIDLATLESTMRSESQEIFEKRGIQLVDYSPQQLVISLHYERDVDLPKSHYAIQVQLELREEAVLSRSWSTGEASTIWVTSWRYSFLRLTSNHQASKMVVEEVIYAVTELAQKIVQARVYGVNKGAALSIRPATEPLHIPVMTSAKTVVRYTESETSPISTMAVAILPRSKTRRPTAKPGKNGPGEARTLAPTTAKAKSSKPSATTTP